LINALRDDSEFGMAVPPSKPWLDDIKTPVTGNARADEYRHLENRRRIDAAVSCLGPRQFQLALAVAERGLFPAAMVISFPPIAFRGVRP